MLRQLYCGQGAQGPGRTWAPGLAAVGVAGWTWEALSEASEQEEVVTVGDWLAS